MNSLRITAKRSYKKPPLVEAVFEVFTDKPSDSWNDDSFGRVFARFPEYSEREEELVAAQVTLGRSTQAPVVKQLAARRRRWHTDGNRLIQVGPEMCACNIVKNYTTFKDYLPFLERFFDAWLEEAQPGNVRWTGQRYINLVRIPVAGDAAAYFTLLPQLPEPIKRGHRPLAVQVETVQVANGAAMVNLGFRAFESGSALYVLDIYARSREILPVDAVEIAKWHTEAHVGISESFELSITDKGRGLFEVEVL